jgi:hypothetical protein
LEGRDDRAWRGKRKINARLALERDPDDWDLPPKPKWMRWRTYNRHVGKYDEYEAILDQGGKNATNPSFCDMPHAVSIFRHNPAEVG